MARLSYPDPAQLLGETQRRLAQLPPLHLFQMLAHAETALDPILLLGKAILRGQELAPHLREMAILQVAKHAEADYEWVQHVPIAKAAGVTDEQIALVKQGSTESVAFDLRMKLVLHAAQEVVVGPFLSEETFAGLQAHFPPRQIVELLMSIGYYMMMGRLMTTLKIDLDPPACNTVVETVKK